jgi:dsRNA-specific ribonuclease
MTAIKVSHKTNAWGRVEYRIVDTSISAKKPCFEIRFADNNEMHGYAATRDEAGRYIEGTLQGVVVE